MRLLDRLLRALRPRWHVHCRVCGAEASLAKDGRWYCVRCMAWTTEREIAEDGIGRAVWRRPPMVEFVRGCLRRDGLLWGDRWL